jgi:hypothetical protein
MRKQGSLFSTVVNYINTIPVGQTYKVADLIKETRGAEQLTWWKSLNDEAYRTRTYQTYLKRAGFLENVKRGEWKVVASIPDWLDSGVLNCILGYTSFSDGISASTWKEKVLSYRSIQKKKQSLETEIEKHNNMKGPQPGEAITTIQCMDPMTACIELRKIGVLAVPVNLGEIEIHVINKEAYGELADWLINNGFDDIDEFPELKDMLWPFFQVNEVEVDDDDCDCEKVYLTVLNYKEGSVTVHKVIHNDVYDFLEEEYGEGYDEFLEYMTSEELKLNMEF